MAKMFLWILSLVALLAVSAGPVSAQEPPPTPDDLILRPGDTITWSPSAPHRVRFGGTVTTPNGTVTLTPFGDVQKVLDISPPLTADAQGVALAPTGAQVTATVKAGAATSGVSEFFFTCGFNLHTGLMVTVSFKIAPARNVEIVSADNPPRWLLKPPPPPPQGNKKLTRP